MLHALLPGRGKAVLVSFCAGSGKLAATRPACSSPRAAPLELAIQVPVVVIAIALLWRAVRLHRNRVPVSGPLLAMASGLIACPPTAFIMADAATRDEKAFGLILSAAFAAGMIVTGAAFPVAAIFRTHMLASLERAGTLGHRLGQAIGLLSASAILLPDLVPIVGAESVTPPVGYGRSASLDAASAPAEHSG